MTHSPRNCSVLLLPAGEMAATYLSPSEAAAWIRGYNEALPDGDCRAVLAPAARLAPSQPAPAARRAESA
jgi:hypothetical protein